MMEMQAVQHKGFRNLKDKDGNVIGFQVGIRFVAYRGPWLSQFRFKFVKVDGVEYGPEVCTFVLGGVEYTYEEMLQPQSWRIKWQMNAPCYIRVKKPGGLTSGSHKVGVNFWEIASYIPEALDTLSGEFFSDDDPSKSRELILV